MEQEDLDSDTIEVVFSDKEKTRKALNNLYGKMWFTSSNGGFNCFSNGGNQFLDTATDDAVTPSEKDLAKVFTYSTLDASSTPFYNANPWSVYYQAIRSANLFMANIGRTPLTDEEKVLMKEEARLLRAIYYHELFRLYGALVIMGDELVDGMTTGLNRASLDDTIDYIVSEFDAVINDKILPDHDWEESGDYGRMTRGIAYAYKARTLLYAASPLNNESNDLSKWKKAADAAKDLIDLEWYSLHYDSSNAELSFARFFNERKTSENILSFLRSTTQDLYKNLPPGAPWNSGTTWPGTAMTMNALDAFEMQDGSIPITGYDSDGSPLINPASGYDDSKPFSGRDPRLDMTIMHDGSTWTVNKTKVTMDINLHTSVNTLRISNLCIRKFLDDRIDHWSSSVKTNINLPMMRYAEILLDYAEAENETGTSNHEPIIDALNLVRERAGADLLEKTGWTTETLRKQIHAERRMELMLEGHRFYDVRRWKECKEYFNAPIYGMDKVNGKYTRKIIQTRVFQNKQYRLPVPSRDVVGSNGRIWQNTGW